MNKAGPKNIASSVYDRLKNKAKETDRRCRHEAGHGTLLISREDAMPSKNSAHKEKEPKRHAPAVKRPTHQVVTVRIPEVGELKLMQPKVAAISAYFGGPTAVARLLGVAKSQPGRWLRGTESPSPSIGSHILDLEYVVSRLGQLYSPEVGETWLRSANAFLNGARPLDVLMSRGPRDVIAAIDATMAGSYA